MHECKPLFNGMNGAHVVMGVFDPDPTVYGGAAWLNYVDTGVQGRGLHSVTLELNLSNSRTHS